MAIFSRVIVLVLALACTALLAAEPRLDISGVTPELDSNIRLHIGKLTADELQREAHTRRIIEAAVAQALQPFGYYRATVAIQFAADKLSLQVTPGPQMLWGVVDVQVTGGAASEPAMIKLLRQSPMREGRPLNHQNYDSLKEEMLELCRTLGYFDAKMLQAQLQIDSASYLALPVLHLDSGSRYRFGEVQFSGSQLDPRLLESIARIEPGRDFDRAHIQLIEGRLRDSNYFNSVAVLAQPQAGDTVDLDIDLVDIDTSRLDVGAGYSTDTDLRLRLIHNNPVIGPQGHSLDVETEISMPRQTLEGTYRIPAPDPLESFYEVRAGIQNKNVEDTDSLAMTTGVRKFANLWDLWQWNYGVSAEFERYTIGAEAEQDVFYLMPGAGLSQTQLQPGIDPLSGRHYLAMAETSSTQLGAETNFLRLRVAGKWLNGFLDGNTTLLTRMEFGAILTEDPDKIPASLRFYAGGDNNIRGFDYESVSPEDDAGNLVGGRYLAVGSIELSRRVLPRWRVAIFTDAGSAFDDELNDYSQSVGFGVRWLSPVGQIRVDLGFPISNEEVSLFRLHINMGPPL